MTESINIKRPRDLDEISSQSQRPKLSSSIVVVNKSQQDGEINNEDNDTTSSVQNSIKTRSDVDVHPENRNRNKRMFGSLVGHLGLARRNLEKDVIISKQNTVATSVLHKNLEESKRLSDLRQNSLKTKLANDKKVELEMLTNIWRKNVLQLKNFIQTDTSPKICWLPAHHNDATNALLERRNNEIDNLVLERERSDTQTISNLFQIKKSFNQHKHNHESSEVSLTNGHDEEESHVDSESVKSGEMVRENNSNDNDNNSSNNSPHNENPEVNEDEEDVSGSTGRPSEADLW